LNLAAAEPWISWLADRVYVRWQLRKKNINQMPVTGSNDEIRVSQLKLLSTSITKQKLNEHGRVEPYSSVFTVFKTLNISDGTVFDCQLDSVSIEAEINLLSQSIVPG